MSHFSLRPTQGRPILPWRGGAVCYWKCGAGVPGEKPLHLRVPWTTWSVSKHHIWSTAVSSIHSPPTDYCIAEYFPKFCGFVAICKTFGGMASFDTAKVSNPRNCINVSCYSVCILHGSVRLDARSEFHKWLGNGYIWSETRITRSQLKCRAL